MVYKDRILKFRSYLENDLNSTKFEIVYYDDNGNLVVPYHIVIQELGEISDD